MSSFAIVVTAPNADSQSASSACHFIQAAVALGHTIKGVFFYGAGVHNANAFQTLLSDEFNILSHWRTLSDQHDIPLLVCVTAANRRGLQSELDAPNNGITDQFNLRPPFQSVGLGELVSLSQDVDRVLQF